MKPLDIPIYPNIASSKHPHGFYCAEISLKMALSYFEPHKKYSLSDLESATGKLPDKSTWPLKMGLWLHNNGYNVRHYTDFNYADFLKDGVSYIERLYGKEAADWQAKNSDIDLELSRVPEYVKAVEVIDQKPTTDLIEKLLSKGWMVIPSVNSAKLNDVDGYVGHAVLATGFDEESITYNDPGLPAIKNRSSIKSDFQAAMDSFGGQIIALQKK